MARGAGWELFWFERRHAGRKHVAVFRVWSFVVYLKGFRTMNIALTRSVCEQILRSFIYKRDIEDITRFPKDMDFIFEWQKYLTS